MIVCLQLIRSRIPPPRINKAYEPNRIPANGTMNRGKIESIQIIYKIKPYICSHINLQPMRKDINQPCGANLNKNSTL